MSAATLELCFERALDGERLGKQLGATIVIMMPGMWKTLSEISAAIHDAFPSIHAPEASVSARLRQMRTLGWTINRRRRGVGPVAIEHHRDGEAVGGDHVLANLGEHRLEVGLVRVGGTPAEPAEEIGRAHV